MSPFCWSASLLLMMMQATSGTKVPLGVSTPTRTTTTVPNLKFPWCKTASIDESGKVVTDSIVNTQQLGDQTFDQSQSSQWMEYIERSENRVDDEGGAGAYDTMRCDIVFPITSDEGHENVVVWGEDFHLNRLKRSYMALYKQPVSDQQLEESIQDSKRIIKILLSLATADAKSKHDLRQLDSSGETFIVLVRVTILWSSHQTQGTSTPFRIRGHACSSFQLQYPNKVPSMTASLAVQLREDEVGRREFFIDETMPTRHADPQNKIASWTRQRKQLEVTSKDLDIEEVLMVREREDDKGTKRLEILEGLSSNFFVILKNGTVRTATEGCLHGYVRHQVLSLLDQCGLKFDPMPIFVDESGEWEEAFITSSSRLIYPIERVIIVAPAKNENDDETTEFWKYNKLLGTKDQEMKCLTLRKQMLRSNGYKI